MTISQSIVKFLEYVKHSRSYATARAYATGLRHFECYLASLSLDPGQVSVETLTPPLANDFIPWLGDYLLHEVAGGDEAKVSRATKSIYLIAVGCFFDYLIHNARLLPWSSREHDALRRALADAAKQRRRTEIAPDKLPRQEIVDALRTQARQPLTLPDEMPEGEKRRQTLAWRRNIAMVEALISSGMRVGELVRLERGHLLYDLHGAVVKYAKGGKERTVLFSEEAWSATQVYLRARQDGGQEKPLASLPVFARHDRKAGSRVLPLSTRSVQNVFADLTKRAGIVEEFHLTPHTLRHFFATGFLSETGDLALTQYALGHASPVTTRIYAKTKLEDYVQAHRDVFEGDKPCQ
jgi:integrase/recombinase XerC